MTVSDEEREAMLAAARNVVDQAPPLPETVVSRLKAAGLGRRRRGAGSTEPERLLPEAS